MWIYKSGLSAKVFLQAKKGCSKKYLEELSAEYDKLKDSPVRELSLSAFREYFTSGSRLTYEREYFRRRIMLRDFALMAWLGYDDALPRLETVLNAVCDEMTWALPAHITDENDYDIIDLFAAETAQTLAEISSLLKDRLSADIVYRCVNEVHRRVLDPFIQRKEQYNWETMKSNWCAVCGGSVGMAAIYLLEDLDDMKRVTDSLTSVFKSYMESFSDDGACLEGLYYWNYGMLYLTAFLDLYAERTGEKFPINSEKLSKMAGFARKCCISDGITVSFSDGSERDRVYGGLSSKLYEMYNVIPADEEYRAHFSGDECGRWCRAARDIAWDGENTPTERESISVLPEAQWAVIRGENTAFAVKGGCNGEPHNHNDVGSFTAVKNGEVILCDLGAGEYTREYFSDKRYDIFCTASRGHSVPVINGCGQKYGPEYSSLDFTTCGKRVSLDISGAYGTCGVKACIRNIELDRGAIKLTDIFQATGKIIVTERFITRHNARVTDGVIEIISGGKCAARLSANIGTLEIKKEKHREHSGEVSEITVIDYTFEAGERTDFELAIY